MSAKATAHLLAITSIALMALGIWITPAHANPPPLSEPACLNCHENLYYLHDMGKWYCISEARTRCTDCHGGDPLATTEDTAHQGLIAYPIINGNVSKCQQCHPQDYAAHVRKFEQIAGIPVVYVAAAYTPASPATVETVQTNVPATGSRASPYVWQAFGVILIVLVLGGAWLLCVGMKRRYKP